MLLQHVLPRVPLVSTPPQLAPPARLPIGSASRTQLAKLARPAALATIRKCRARQTLTHNASRYSRFLLRAGVHVCACACWVHRLTSYNPGNNNWDYVLSGVGFGCFSNPNAICYNQNSCNSYCQFDGSRPDLVRLHVFVSFKRPSLCRRFPRATPAQFAAASRSTVLRLLSFSFVHRLIRLQSQACPTA